MNRNNGFLSLTCVDFIKDSTKFLLDEAFHHVDTTLREARIEHLSFGSVGFDGNSHGHRIGHSDRVSGWIFCEPLVAIEDSGGVSLACIFKTSEVAGTHEIRRRR